MIAVKTVFGQFLHSLYHIRLPVAFLWKGELGGHGHPKSPP